MLPLVVRINLRKYDIVIKIILFFIFSVNLYALEKESRIPIEKETPSLKEFFVTCHEKIRKGSVICTLEFQKKEIKMIFAADWCYHGEFNKEDICRYKDYIIFTIFIKNNDIVFWEKNYPKNHFNDFKEIINEVAGKKKICFYVGFDEKQYKRPFSEAWDTLSLLHKFSENRVMYSIKN